MKAVLIWPAFADYSSLDGTWIPHGVCQLATCARPHQVDVWDGRVMSIDDCKRGILDTKAEVIGFSVITAYKDYARELITFAKRHRPGIKIVVGGIHPSVTEDTLDADYVVKGEGEITFKRILDGEIEPGVIRGEVPDLGTLVPIDRTLVTIPEQPMMGLEEPFATIIIGRGCPHNCTYCQPAERTLFGKRLRLRPVQSVVSEIEGLNVKSFMVHDDCFTSSARYAEEFCEAVKGRWTWWCQGRADQVVKNPTLIRKMRDAGLRGMILGHESGDDRVLEYMRKGCTARENIESVRILKALGVMTWSNIMFGLPGEPPSAVINTIAMLEEMRPDTVSMCAFTPHPGSELYEYCKENDLMPDDPPQEYFNRGRFEPKIVGPDYLFLGWAAQQMQRIFK